MNLDSIQNDIVYLTRHGSHAYGTNIETSDIDTRGVFIADRANYLGFLNTVGQVQDSKNDTTIFELTKFMKLAMDCNPNAIEVLFTDDSDVLKVTPAGVRLREHRDQFISQKAKHTFSGYAVSQLKRIQRHYRWLKNPPKAPPTRKECGLPERTVIPADQLSAARSLIKKKIESWGIDFDQMDASVRIQIQVQLEKYLTDLSANLGLIEVPGMLEQAAGRSLGLSDNFLELLDMERGYRARQDEWKQYQTWLKQRNPARAALEEKWGYDTKHGMHLVRLMRMGEEILTTGKVIVKRPDREELLAIRAGAWDYEKLVEWAEKKEQKLDEIYKSGASPLPKQPNRNKLDQLCVELVFDKVKG